MSYALCADGTGLKHPESRIVLQYLLNKTGFYDTYVSSGYASLDNRNKQINVDTPEYLFAEKKAWEIEKIIDSVDKKRLQKIGLKDLSDDNTAWYNSKYKRLVQSYEKLGYLFFVLGGGPVILDVLRGRFL